MYVTINGKFFDKMRQSAKKTNIENIGEEDQKSEDTLTWEELTSEITELEITENNISVSLDSKLGYFNFDIPLDTDELIELLTIATKKFNKFKAVLEGLK